MRLTAALPGVPRGRSHGEEARGPRSARPRRTAQRGSALALGALLAVKQAMDEDRLPGTITSFDVPRRNWCWLWDQVSVSPKRGRPLLQDGWSIRAVGLAQDRRRPPENSGDR